MGESTFTADGTAPFVFDDNWDNFGNLRPESRRLSATNADGVPVVPLTEEQKFAFDTQGWLCIPGAAARAARRDAPQAQVAVPPRLRRSGQHGSGHAQPVRPGAGLRR